MRTVNVIFGSYINAYAIIQELSENGVPNIVVVDVYKDMAAYSNKIIKYYQINNSEESILNILKTIHKDYNFLILYPTQDIYLIHLSKLFEKIKDYTFLAFNPESVICFMDKSVQYKFCEQLNIPYPKTSTLTEVDQFEKLEDIQFPILVKPSQRDNISNDIFRSKTFNNIREFRNSVSDLSKYIEKRYNFLVSEIIPGDGSNIFAYVSYRSKSGEILGEWSGKKLSQFPDDFGVFASASNEAPEIITKLGRTLIEGMNLSGINEPEFKFDYRDNQYKLMEINLRPMMWHRIGPLSGVPLNYIQYLEATDKLIPTYKQIRDPIIHYINLNYEIINVFRRKNYWRSFYYNLFKAEKLEFVGFSSDDILPSVMSIKSLLRRLFRKIYAH